MTRPSSTMAAAVSSHDVSMPRMRVTSSPRLRALEDRRSGQPALERVHKTRILRLVDLVRPHHESVLAGVGVIALAHADGLETESSVELLRAFVRQPYFEGERGRTARHSLTRRCE